MYCCVDIVDKISNFRLAAEIQCPLHESYFLFFTAHFIQRLTSILKIKNHMTLITLEIHHIKLVLIMIFRIVFLGFRIRWNFEYQISRWNSNNFPHFTLLLFGQCLRLDSFNVVMEIVNIPWKITNPEPLFIKIADISLTPACQKHRFISIIIEKRKKGSGVFDLAFLLKLNAFFHITDDEQNC